LLIKFISIFIVHLYQYVAGAVILGGSPCTAMVFVWSNLVHGHAAYTLIQVAINDLLVLVLYVPTLYLLLDLSGVNIPYVTIVLSVIIFVVVPFALGSVTRWWLLRNRTDAEGEQKIQHVEQLFTPIVMIGLLATVILTFIFQGPTIRVKWLNISLIAIPLILQTYISWAVAYTACYFAGVEWNIAAPASFISSSNFFELAIAVALSAYGVDSGATLATTVGVLTEVPVMLSLVEMTKRTKERFQSKRLFSRMAV
jgi:ACR3 family arsenite transporter